MSEYWTPSGSAFVVSATAKLVVSASGQAEGLARFINTSATVGFVGFVSASGSIGVADLVPIDGNATLFIAFATPDIFAVGTGSPDILVNPGYALK